MTKHFAWLIFRTVLQRVYTRHEARKQQAKYYRVGAVNRSIVKLGLTKGAYQVFHSNGFVSKP